MNQRHWGHQRGAKRGLLATSAKAAPLLLLLSLHACKDSTPTAGDDRPLSPLASVGSPSQPITGTQTCGFYSGEVGCLPNHNGIDIAGDQGTVVRSPGHAKVIAYTKATAQRFGSVDPDFPGPATWLRLTLANGAPLYMMVGHVSETWDDHSVVSGGVLQEFAVSYVVPRIDRIILAGDPIGKIAPFYRRRHLASHAHIGFFLPKKDAGGGYFGPPTSGWGAGDKTTPEGEWISPAVVFSTYSIVLSPGKNTPPVVTILAPDASTPVSQTSELQFKGECSDAEDGLLTNESLVWSSSIDGIIGSGSSFVRRLSLGHHRITLTATDKQGAVANRSVDLTVVDSPISPPISRFLLSSTGQSVRDGHTLSLAVPEFTSVIVDMDASLTSAGADAIAEYAWTVNGIAVGTGAKITRALSQSTNSVQLVVTSVGGQSSTAVGTVNLLFQPVPVARFSMLAAGTSAIERGTLTLVADPAVGSDVAFDAARSSAGSGSIAEFEWRINGATTSTAPSFTTRVKGSTSSVQLRIVNGFGQFSMTNAEIKMASSTTAPIVSAVNPASPIATNAPQAFTIVGTNFVSGANVTLRDLTTNEVFPNRAIGSLTSTQIVINPNFGTATTAHNWTVQVTNTDNQSSPQFAFTVQAPAAAAPTVSAVNPASPIATNAPQAFTIVGTNFVSGANVTLRDLTTSEVFPNRAIGSLTSTQIVINPNFGTATTAHSWTVQVTNTDARASNTFAFTVRAP